MAYITHRLKEKYLSSTFWFESNRLKQFETGVGTARNRIRSARRLPEVMTYF
jgi:hypothetical protein